MSSKLTLRFFTVPEWEKEQDYLRSMHRKGWRFVRYTPLCFYRFESCEPEDVVYQLDYNEDGATRHGDEYFQLFRDCGWEFVQYFAGFSYFRKPASELRGEEGHLQRRGLPARHDETHAHRPPAAGPRHPARLCPVLRGTT